ncbi:hypothetical protein ACFSO9_06525 [Mesonia maritima]|uniref:hypothetical protein n=1 Tax=Mesonia maritima TaxID=1793873 RepID=UPI003643872B
MAIFEVKLNNQIIQSQRTFQFNITPVFSYFGAFADVTNIVANTGNGQYTFSDFDLTQQINTGYCSGRVNFGGWSIIIVYEDQSLPLNQVNIYDGFQGVPNSNSSFIQINLSNLNVIDNQGAKIGFLAWEGDKGLALNETLRINGNIISNPPLNPPTNAFNGTNSFTGDSNFYNMDLDVYNIQNNINIGDDSALIELTSSSDIIVINNVVTVLNSELPEPSPEITNISGECNSREIEVDYTIYNTNATDFLPANTLISFFLLMDNLSIKLRL